MTNVEDEIRARTPNEIYNREFTIKFSLAINELEGDPAGLVVFMNAVLPVFKQFAKNNGMSFDKFWDNMRKYVNEAGLDDMEFIPYDMDKEVKP